MEIAPKYVDTAVIRWQEFTGRKVVLERNGRTFEHVVIPRSTDFQTSSHNGEGGRCQ